MPIRALNIGDIALPGSGYPPIEAFDIPVRSGLRGAFFLGDGAQVAQMNWSGTPEQAAIEGNPTWRTGYASFASGARLNTDIPESLSMSMLVVARRTAAAENTGFVGNFSGGGGINGVTIYAQTGSTSMIGGAGRVGSPSGMTAQGVGAVDSWQLGALIVPASGALTIYNETSGQSAATAAVADRAINGAGPMQIGSVYTRTGACDMALALIYNRAVSVAEKNALTSWARAYAERRGITV